MKKPTDTYKLYNGVEIPCIGFGTWQTPDGEVAVSSVRCAIEAGYRHIDTAQVYGNEESVGRGIRESGVSREELFITTKLWNTNHTYDRTMSTFEESMKKLGLDYLDLFLIHWPNAATRICSTAAAAPVSPRARASAWPRSTRWSGNSSRCET